VKDLIGRTEEWTAIQSVTSIWLGKRGDEKCFYCLGMSSLALEGMCKL
jgi:hypothetical protein